MSSDDTDATRPMPAVDPDADPDQVEATAVRKPETEAAAEQETKPAAADTRALYRPDSEPTSVLEATAGEPSGSEPTAVLDPEDPAMVAEAERARARELAAQAEIERAAAAQRQREAERREAENQRHQALGTVTPTEANVDVVPPAIERLNTEKFFGAFGFFLLRLITAGVLGIHGYQHLSDLNGFVAFMERFAIPYPSIMAWVVGIGEVLAAIALLFGILVRVVGLCIAGLAGAALTLVLWGARNPFQSGVYGFVGEVEVLLVGIGLLFFFIGGGGWGIDGGVRRGRARRKAGIY